MAIIAAANGTQSATINTEHTLTTQTTAGIYVLRVDCGAMIAGDTTIIRLKTKALSGGTSRIEQEITLTGVQAKPNWVSDPVPVDVEVACNLTQTAGTGRSYPWKLLRA